MKKYKSIYNESLEIITVTSKAETIVNISNLEWQPNHINKKMTWDEANEYVKSLGDGWRLPTIQELYTASMKGIKPFKTNHYWSSTIYSNIMAWGVYFIRKTVIIGEKQSLFYVVCVR